MTKKYKLFTGFSLLKTWSTYEGLKLGQPDESDFLIETPAVDRSMIEIGHNPQDDYKWIACIKDPTIFHEIYEPSSGESQQHFKINFRVAMKRIVINYIRQNLPENWSIAPKKISDRSKYQAFCFGAKQKESDGNYSKMT